MRKKDLKAFVLAAILLVTAAAAVIHLTTRATVPEGHLQLICGETEREITLSDLDLRPVQGTISNAKGDQRTIEAQGIPVAETLTLAGTEDFSRITVTGDDAYSAELTAEEAEDTENTCFIIQEDNGVQLIVFSDTNSKRNVSNVVRVEVA